MKKWFSVGFSILLVVSLLLACNEKQAEESGESSDATKFSISMRTIGYPYVEKSPNINEDKWVKKLGELTNTELDIILMPHQEYEEKMIQMFATKDIPDVVQGHNGVGGKEMAGSVQAGVFMPLDDLLQEHGQRLLEHIPKEAWEQVTYKGKIYGIPEYVTNPSRRATFIRKDLLDKADLPVPETVDEFLDVLRAFKEMGVEYPYMGREDFRYSDVIFGAFDVLPYLNQFEQQGDKIVPKFLDNENMMKALEVYKTMLDEGLINKEFATTNPSQYKDAVFSGKAGMWTANANELLRREVQLKSVVPEAELAIIPSPVGPDGQGGYFLYDPVFRAYFINKEVKNPEAIVSFFDWMMTEEAEMFFSFGIEGETYEVVDGQVHYTPPTDPDEVDRERFLHEWLWMVQDITYNEPTLNLTEEGRDLKETIDTVLTNEGRGGISFAPRLDALVKHPELSPNVDTGPPMIVEHMVKMVYGEQPISDWPKVIDEWRSKGGDEIIEEATEKFHNEDPETIITINK